MPVPIQGAGGLSWNDIKKLFATEGALNKQYDSDLDGIIDLEAIPTIPRTKLEYPTENVNFAYLHAIGKTSSFVSYRTNKTVFSTKDAFIDKVISGIMEVVDMFSTNNALFGRHGSINGYKYEFMCGFAPSYTTADFRLEGVYDNNNTTYGYEAVDLTEGDVFYVSTGISGFTVKAWRQTVRNLSATPQISAGTSGFPSGSFGVGGVLTKFVELLPPATKLPKPYVILECELISENNTFIPKLVKEIDGNIDKCSVTWGGLYFNYEQGYSLIKITGVNPYTNEKAILKQIEHVKNKNLTIINPPKNYQEAIEQYNLLRKKFADWIFSKDAYAYHAIGVAELDYMQTADFYYIAIIDGLIKNIAKNVPDWEIRKIISTYIDRLKKTKILKSEAEKHLKKLKEVEKKGW